MAVSDQQLLAQWADHRDAEAFTVFCRRHARMVYATCLRVLRDETQAEDVTQECFEVLVALRTPPSGNVGPWLHRVATHRALNRIRSETRQKRREDRYARDQQTRTTVDWDDVYDWVDEAIAQLPKNLREAVVGHFLEGKTHEAVAAEQGVSRAAVTQRIQRGIDRIRKQLKDRGVPIAAPALAALFQASLAEAVAPPPAVTAGLGRLALSGAAPATPHIAITGALLAMKAKTLAFALPLVVLLGLAIIWQMSRQPATPPGPPIEAAAPEAQSEDTLALDKGPPKGTEQAAATVTSGSVNPPRAPLITGKVVTSEGRPVAAALILKPFFEPPPDREKAFAQSASDGSFEIGELPRYTRMLAAWHPDHAPGCARIPSESAGRVDITIVLAEGGAIEGSVHIDGQPVEGQVVQVSYLCDSPFHRSEVRTDAVGAYSVAGLPEGRPRVTIYPKAFGDNIDQLAQVTNGAVTVVDFDLQSQGTAAAEGRVRLGAEPLADAHINATVIGKSGGIREFHTKTDADGHYVLDSLAAGRVILKVTLESGKLWQNYVRDFDLASYETARKDIDLTEGGGTLHCHVVVPGGHSDSHVGVNVLSGEFDLPRFDSETLHHVAAFKVAEPRLQEDGTFLLPNLEPGSYTVLCLAINREAHRFTDTFPVAYDKFATAVIDIAEGQTTSLELALE